MGTIRIQECSRCLIQRKLKILKDYILQTCNLLCINNQILLREVATIPVIVLFFYQTMYMWSQLKMQITIMEFNIKNNTL
jgi:hypothetical protein